MIVAQRNGRVSDAVPRRFAAGDGLRALAALFVLVFHAAIATLQWTLGGGSVNGEASPQQFRPIFGFLAPEFVSMRSGIYIFFALSGYLLTRPFLASYLVGTPMPSIPRYFRNRALRIIPAFWRSMHSRRTTTRLRQRISSAKRGHSTSRSRSTC